jgi:ABC-type multidrug transport system ATPase subunit
MSRDVTPGALELRVGSGRWLLAPGRSIVIGRDAGAEVRIADMAVSRLHAVLECTSAGWVLTDHSRNGVFLDGRRVNRITVDAPTTVWLGRPAIGVEVELAPVGPAVAGHRVGGERIAIGRLPDNDVVLDDLLVSRRHAELHRCAGGWRVVDLASANGTYVNGRRVTEKPLCEGDVVGVGHTLLQLLGDRLVEHLDTGEITFAAHGLVVTIKGGARLLDDVGFALPERSLLAVIGPSGAGKSTLLRALTGVRPADHGSVTYDGRDLYTNYDELRHRIGLVPQDDILHPQLTVRRALSYAARLRFPPDVAAPDRERRIDEVLAELGLAAQTQQRIDSLSGGQRKRTSVALELLTRPSLLFLDEPTSGLDPGLDKSVMQTLRRLADEGRTVVVVTHSVANLAVCDRVLILAPGGGLAFVGPPDEALGFFRQPDYADLFLMLEGRTGRDWAAEFRDSPLFSRYVGTDQAKPPDPDRAARPGIGVRQQSPPAQFAILCRRYLAVIAADRQYLAFLALLPVAISALAHAVPSSDGFSLVNGDSRGEAVQLLLVLVIGGALMGSSASVRELVKERAIYLRERAIGLSLGAYVASKLAVLGLITGAEAVLFSMLSVLGQRGPDDAVLLPSATAEIIVAVLAVTLVAMVVGLAISASIDNADRGMPLLVLLVMVQLIMCGGLFPLEGRVVLQQLSWLVPARWSYAMGAATVDLNRIPVRTSDPLWQHAPASWTGDLLVLVGIGLALLLVTALRLRRLDPHLGGAARRGA